MEPRQGRAAFPKPGWLPLCLDFGDLGKLFLKVKTRFEPTFSSYVGRVGDLDSPTRPTYITATTTITTTLLCCTTVPPCYCVLHLLAVFPFALLPIEPCVAPWACRKPDTARVFPLGGLFFWLFAYPSHLCWPRAEGRKIRTQLYPLRDFPSKSCTTVLGHQVYITLSLLIPTARHVFPVAKAFGRSAATTCWRRHRIPGLLGPAWQQ
jgi:hypothetical protein